MTTWQLNGSRSAGWATSMQFQLFCYYEIYYSIIKRKIMKKTQIQQHVLLYDKGWKKPTQIHNLFFIALWWIWIQLHAEENCVAVHQNYIQLVVNVMVLNKKSLSSRFRQAWVHVALDKPMKGDGANQGKILTWASQSSERRVQKMLMEDSICCKSVMPGSCQYRPDHLIRSHQYQAWKWPFPFNASLTWLSLSSY